MSIPSSQSPPMANQSVILKVKMQLREALKFLGLLREPGERLLAGMSQSSYPSMEDDFPSVA